MTAITLRFHGFYEDVLELLVKRGLAQTKTEAIRLALFNLAMDGNLLDNTTLLKELQKEVGKKRFTPEQVADGIEYVKAKTVR